MKNPIVHIYNMFIKATIIDIVRILLFMVLVYGATSFVVLQWNPLLWPGMARFLFVVFSVGYIALTFTKDGN